MVKNRKRRVWIIVGVLALTAVCLTAYFFRPTPPQAAQPETGEIVAAFIGDLSASAAASGQVTPAREASLSFSTPGRVTEVKARVGEFVQAGDVLVQLDTAVLELDLANAQQTVAIQEASLAQLIATPSAANVAAAEAAVANAQASLDDLLAGPSDLERAVYEATVRQAEAAVWSASADLGSSQNSITQSQINAAQAALLQAQIKQEQAREANEDNTNQETDQALRQANEAVASAQAQLDSLLAGADTAAAQNSAAAAAARLDGSQADFNRQLAGATAAQIASAQAQVAQAESSLAALVAAPSAAELASAEANVAQARLAQTAAEEALAKAALVAPFDGVVTAVNISEGETASGVVVELVDPSSLELILQVDEVDIGALEVGQAAVITLESWPDEEITSSITAIAPNADTSGGTVTYQVHLNLASELPVRVGMTANARLITSQRDDVLLLPNRAITADRQAGKYYVNLVQGEGDSETVEKVEVTTGLRDNQYTQILDGLNEGDQVRIGEVTVGSNP